MTSAPLGVVHQLDVYGTYVHLCRTEKQVKRLAKSMPGAELPTVEESLASTSSVQNHEAPFDFHVVFVFHDGAVDQGDALLANTCAHEAAHAAGMILRHIGAELDPQQEHAAYLIGWLTEWLWVQLR